MRVMPFLKSRLLFAGKIKNWPDKGKTLFQMRLYRLNKAYKMELPLAFLQTEAALILESTCGCSTWGALRMIIGRLWFKSPLRPMNIWMWLVSKFWTHYYESRINNGNH